MEKDILVKVENVSKKFGNVVALDSINLKIKKNEIIGLLGDNGAGKSTLIKILAGVHQPDQGCLYWEGKRLDNYSATKADNFGIVTVFQDKALCKSHNVWRNIFMGREITNRFGFVNFKKERAETEHLMKNIMGFRSAAINANGIVKLMSGGEQAGVAISRALYFYSKLIILDEPTADLSLKETKKVLNFVKRIKEEGKSCIFISHNIFHAYEVSERFIILDRGKIETELLKKDIEFKELENRMFKAASEL